MGASAFPQNAGYNPTGTLAALAFWAAEAIRTQYLKNPGPARPCLGRSDMSSRRSSRSRCSLRSGCRPHPAPARAGTALDPQNFTQIERGRYLTIVGDCASCHTDPTPRPPFAGGRAIETPFGNVLAANITPDRDTGIGGWSDDQFVESLREGKSPNGSCSIRRCPIRTTRT